KAIIKDSSIPRRVDPNSVEQYLSYGYIPSPSSILEKVNKLLPGHYITINRGRLKVTQYWDIKYKYNYSRSDEEDAENIMDILRSSVEMRMISDVPLGAFLSGGIDSSAVVGLMSQVSNKPVKTFSIGFKEDEYNELNDARLIAKTFHTEHYEKIVEPESIELIPELVWYYDEPFADDSAIPTYYVSKHAREHVKVVLSGDGGDELFGGYLRYLTSKRDRFFLKLPEFLRCNVLGAMAQIMPKSLKGRNYFNYISQGDEQRYLIKVGCFPEYRKNELYTGDFINSIEKRPLNYLSNISDRDLQTRYLFFDSKAYLPDDILVKVDKASMARSLEARIPILDYRLIEYAATIPPYKKIQGNNQKVIFKKALKNLLPEQVFTKKKHGFGVPLDRWFRKELKDFAYETILSKEATERGYFKKEQVRYILDEHQLGNRDNSFFIWALLFLELWHKQFIK
ncbi:MAG: asparagine synthase (glutamine-hydrolyzing), partial [Planctomycetota bacterium]